MELGVHLLWNYVELFWNSLDNAPIVFYLEMKEDVEVGVRDIRSRFAPRIIHFKLFLIKPKTNDSVLCLIWDAIDV